MKLSSIKKLFEDLGELLAEADLSQLIAELSVNELQFFFKLKALCSWQTLDQDIEIECKHFAKELINGIGLRNNNLLNKVMFHIVNNVKNLETFYYMQSILAIGDKNIFLLDGHVFDVNELAAYGENKPGDFFNNPHFANPNKAFSESAIQTLFSHHKLNDYAKQCEELLHPVYQDIDIRIVDSLLNLLNAATIIGRKQNGSFNFDEEDLENYLKEQNKFNLFLQSLPQRSQLAFENFIVPIPTFLGGTENRKIKANGVNNDNCIKNELTTRWQFVKMCKPEVIIPAEILNDSHNSRLNVGVIVNLPSHRKHAASLAVSTLNIKNSASPLPLYHEQDQKYLSAVRSHLAALLLMPEAKFNNKVKIQTAHSSLPNFMNRLKKLSLYTMLPRNENSVSQLFAFYKLQTPPSLTARGMLSQHQMLNTDDGVFRHNLQVFERLNVVNARLAKKSEESFISSASSFMSICCDCLGLMGITIFLIIMLLSMKDRVIEEFSKVNNVPEPKPETNNEVNAKHGIVEDIYSILMFVLLARHAFRGVREKLRIYNQRLPFFDEFANVVARQWNFNDIARLGNLIWQGTGERRLRADEIDQLIDGTVNQPPPEIPDLDFLEDFNPAILQWNGEPVI